MEGGLDVANSEETIPVDKPFSSAASSGVSLRLVQELAGHDDRVWGVAWRPCGGSSILASCSGDKTKRIWEHSARTSPSSATWACKAVLDSSHTRTVWQVSWSPTGNLLASASFDATIGMWEYVDRDFSFIASFEEDTFLRRSQLLHLSDLRLNEVRRMWVTTAFDYDTHILHNSKISVGAL